MNLCNCITQDVTPLTDQIYRVRIQPNEGRLFDFKAGQYLFLIMPGGNRVPLSIASAPEETQFIELHIRLMASGGLVEEMLNLFRSTQVFQIEGPHGQCFLSEGDHHAVFIAGGTGFSPMKSMLESALASGVTRDLSLYLGAQTPGELYQNELILPLSNRFSNFTYVPVVGESSASWQGETGFPHQVALRHLGETAAQCEYYVSGSELMVVNVYRALLDAGVAAQRIHSDILDIKRDKGELTD